MAKTSKEKFQDRGKFKGLTKKQYKRQYGSVTAGREKTANCRATGLDKALIKYPRAHKVFPHLYITVNKKKDKFARGRGSFFDSL